MILTRVFKLFLAPDKWLSSYSMICYRTAHFFWNYGLHWFALVIMFACRIITGIYIHPGAKIGKKLMISNGQGVVIGESAILGDNAIIFQQVTLGARTGRGGGIVRINERVHPMIGDGVLMGTGAKILGPVVIGQGAKIGANAVVLMDVPPYATAVGAPARIIMHEDTTPQSSLELE